MSAAGLGRTTILILSLGGAAASAGEGPPAATPISFEADVVPFVARHCISCHGTAKEKGGINLEAFRNAAAAAGDPQTWEKAARMLRTGAMPPESRLRPPRAETDRVLLWIQEDLAAALRQAKSDPGRVTIRRLNRIEYENTVRDLLGVEFRARDEFPADDVGYGFDTIGDVLSLPPMLFEKFLAAAETIASAALKSAGEARKRLLERSGGGPLPIPEAIARIAERAWRRPLAPGELDRLLALERGGESPGDPDGGIRLALEAVLVSPHFIFRVEIHPEPGNPAAVSAVGEFELASRLSYFLWSSMPDAELFDLARRGELSRSLGAQARRLLADPKSQALVENFAGQWLQTRNLRTVQPDPARFPAFDEELRDSMRRETEMFFAAVMREDRSILDLLDGDFTYLNERLARLYGVPGVEGPGFRRVELTGSRRRGVAAQASVLTVTSNPTRTSPVKRGRWILEVLLGAPPPPPPPDVPQLPEEAAAAAGKTLRERMEQHRSDPSCASCHQRMDPLGFGLENFDAIGAWRETDSGLPIDAKGVLPDGRRFGGPQELSAILRKDADAFRRCLTEKLLTYALGRGLDPADRPAVDRIQEALVRGADRFPVLVEEIVQSEPFRFRRGERGAP